MHKKLKKKNYIFAILFIIGDCVNNINVAKDVVSLQTCHVCKTILNSKDCVTANNVDAIVLL